MPYAEFKRKYHFSDDEINRRIREHTISVYIDPTTHQPCYVDCDPRHETEAQAQKRRKDWECYADFGWQGRLWHWASTGFFPFMVIKMAIAITLYVVGIPIIVPWIIIEGLLGLDKKQTGWYGGRYVYTKDMDFGGGGGLADEVFSLSDRERIRWALGTGKYSDEW